jgi:hypothetical protein
MSPSLHAIIVGCDHSYQIWKTLQVYFESQTRAKVNHLKIQLKGIKKTTSFNDYQLSIKKIVDTLASVGSPIDESEHISILLWSTK